MSLWRGKCQNGAEGGLGLTIENCGLKVVD